MKLPRIAHRALAAVPPVLRSPTLARWLSAPLAVALAAAAHRALLPDPAVAPFVLTYVGVAVAASVGGRGPGLAAVALTAVTTWLRFFTPGTDAGRHALHAVGVFTLGAAPVALLCASSRAALLRAREAMAALEQQTELLQQSYDAVLVWRADGPIESWSPGAEVLYGWSAAEAVGASPHELLRTVFPEPLREVEARLAAERRWEGQLAHTTRSGRVVTVDSRMQLTRGHDGAERVLETNRDATERVRAEERIRRLNEELARRAGELDAERRRWRGVVEGIADEIWVADESGRITFVSTPGEPRRYAHFEGRRADEVCAALGLCRAEGAVRAPEDAPLLRSLAGETLRGEELLGDPGAGHPSVREYSSAPVRDDAGRVVGAVAIVRDVTEHKRLEAALRDADRKKDDFLAMLSHELRNPLAPIRSSLHVLERADADPARAARARAIIGHQVAHMTRLVGDLLDVGRIRRGKVELVRAPVDLAVVVARAVEDHRAVFAARGVALEARGVDAPAWVSGDADRLHQVLGNLLHNAAKYTPPSGRVDVELAREGALALVRVRDTGVGLAPDALETIFEPFTQGPRAPERAAGGLGLGLTLVKGLVELHGGDVRAASDGPGRGAEITFRLPLEPGADRERPVGAAAPSSHGRRVLLVEDNLDAAESLRDALELDRHEVELAHSGPDALAQARARHPEVVLCDIGLPTMDGYEVARAFRSDAALRGVTLVALTGYAGAEDRRRALAAGFDEHLAKPPDLDELERILAEAPRRAA